MFEKIKAFFGRWKKKKEEPKPAETPAETVVFTFEEPAASQTPAENAEEPAADNAVSADAELSAEEEEDVPSGRYTPEYMEFLEKLDKEAEEAGPPPTETDEVKGIDAPAVRK